MVHITTATTWLFVPGDRPERFDKAEASGADVVILDLQDAVAETSKLAARDNVTAWLQHNEAVVRINEYGHPNFAADLAAVEQASGAAAVMLPHADPRSIAALADLAPQTAVVALVESGSGVAGLAEVGAHPQVRRLALGHLDLAADLDCEPGWESLLYARGAFVVESRAHDLPGPIDGITSDLSDIGAAGTEARRARSLGFLGKLCIHPNQVTPVRDAFAPTSADEEWARRVLDAAGDGGSRIDGQFVDRPVLQRARAIVARANRGGNDE